MNTYTVSYNTTMQGCNGITYIGRNRYGVHQTVAAAQAWIDALHARMTPEQREFAGYRIQTEADWMANR
jgi:hypothetical protein